MNTNPNRRPPRRAGALMTELMVAIAIIAIALLPLMGSFAQLYRSIRVSYQRAVAMELIDGEMEILVAGEWRAFQPGTQAYKLRGQSLTNLPPGTATLTIAGNRVRLEWQPDKKNNGGKVTREAIVR